jgi:7-cyano-7-deazaguanine synthase
MKKKKAVVIHSGGMDSSICLALAIQEFGKEAVLSLSFDFGQRHSTELVQAQKICKDWNVDHAVVDLNCLKKITDNALINKELLIQENDADGIPNTLVVGRNGLMARLGAIHADFLGADYIYMGIIGVEGNFSGYRDCSRQYMDLKQQLLRIDLNNPKFEIRTPVVHMTKKETLEVAHSLSILKYLMDHTITCYEGIPKEGCKKCPACHLRHKGIQEFKKEYPGILE